MPRSRIAELEEAPVYRSKRTPLGAEWESVGGVTGEDMSTATRNRIDPNRDYDDPSLVRVLYHAYDGRVVPIADSFARIRIDETFPRTDATIPAKWRGKNVWYLDESQVDKPEMPDNTCPLSPDAPDEVKDEVRAMGFVPGVCSKQHIPNIRDHTYIKHRKFFDERRDFRAQSSTDRQAQAMIDLAESLKPKG